MPIWEWKAYNCIYQCYFILNKSDMGYYITIIHFYLTVQLLYNSLTIFYTWNRNCSKAYIARKTILIYNKDCQKTIKKLSHLGYFNKFKDCKLFHITSFILELSNFVLRLIYFNQGCSSFPRLPLIICF